MLAVVSRVTKIGGIAGNTKSVNNVAYKSFIVKPISVNKPSSVAYLIQIDSIYAISYSNRFYLNKNLFKLIENLFKSVSHSNRIYLIRY